MSTFVPKHLTPFQQALDRLGPSATDEFRQALYAGTVRASLMDDGEITLPPHWWASDRAWNKAVAEGRGSISAGPTYFEEVRRGPILVWSDDVNRLLASIQHKAVAEAVGATVGPCSTSPIMDGWSYDSALDPRDAAYWNVLQTLTWACTREMKWVRIAADLSRDPTQLIYQAILSGTVLSFEAAEADVIKRLSIGELRSSGPEKRHS